MLRWLTAGESHGPALLATLEGLPAGVAVTTDDVAAALARRRLGFGRGARMKFERDEVEFLGGVRHGRTLGSPIAIRIGNSEWPKWRTVMSPDPVSEAEYAAADDVNAEKEIDLGADSLDTVELVMALEEEFDTEIPDEEAEKITTVQAAIDYITANQE